MKKRSQFLKFSVVQKPLGQTLVETSSGTVVQELRHEPWQTTSVVERWKESRNDTVALLYRRGRHVGGACAVVRTTTSP